MNNMLTKEFKIGLATVICGLILFFGIDYLKGVNIFKPENYFYIQFNKISGLVDSAPVVLDGFKVGMVREMNYNYSNPGSVVVEIAVDKSLKLPKGTKAVIVSDLLGTAQIELKLNKYVSEYHQISDTLQGEFDLGLMGTLSDKLVPQVELLIPKIDSILTGLNELFHHSKLQESLQNVHAITTELEKTSKSMNKVMDRDLPVLMKDMKSTMANLSQFSSTINDLDLHKTINSINATLANVELVTKQMTIADNSIGLLLNSDGLYNQVLTTIGHTDSLLIDLKQNPKRYVHFSIFGKK